MPPAANGPPWIRLVYTAHPTDAHLDLDLGNLDAKSTSQSHYCAPFYDPVVPIVGTGVSMGYMDTGLWLCSPIHDKLRYTMYSDIIRTSFNFALTEICYDSLSLELDQMGQPSLFVCISELWLPVMLVHHCSFLGPLLIDTDLCGLGTPRKSFRFEDALTNGPFSQLLIHQC